jgi:putative ABC transport system permease protein
VIVVVVTVASGLYPALILSSFAPAIIQSSRNPGVKGNLPRQILIVFQFVITISMIAGTLLIYQQIRFVLSAEVGFDKEHVLVVNLTNDAMLKKDILKEEVSRLPNVNSVSVSLTSLGTGTYSTYIIPEGFNPNEIEARVFQVDANWQNTYGVQVASGRFFDPRLTTDSSTVIINEAMTKRLNWSDAIGKTIRFNEGEPAYPVIGVLKDFHFKSFYEAVEPLIMVMSFENERNLAVRFTGNPSNIISTLEERWKKVEARYPFEYFFVDEAFAKAYQAEEKLLKTVLTFAGLSILIACLGLYGLVSFTIEQRTKEFGIRKVLGASVLGLNYMVNRKFIGLVIVGAAIAVPLVLPFVNDWLQKFALKIQISPLVFLLAFLITLAVTVVAVSIQAIRAGMANPIESLRHE